MKFLVLLSIVVLSSCFPRSDICVPGKIDDITLNGTTEVSWVSNPNGCTIDQFLIEIIDSEDHTDKIFNESGTKLSVNLELCKQYTFDIRAITSEHVSGPSGEVNITTKLSKDDNVGVHFTNITSSNVGVVFNWELIDPSVVRCVTSYKVVYWSEDDSPNNTDVTQPSFTIKNTKSCMTYTFMVSAEVNDEAITPPSINGSTRAIPSGPPGTPTLSKETIASDNADFLFTVQSYPEYRCSFVLILEITGPGLDEKYSANLTDTASRGRVVPMHASNLQPSTMYDANAWTQNESGQSNKLSFQFTTSDP